MHGLAAGDAGCLDLHAAGRRVGDRAVAVDRIAEGVDDTPEQRVADRHREDAPGGLDRLTLFDRLAAAEDHGADRLLVEVEGEAERPVLELEQLVHAGVGETGHAGDAVADLEDATDLGDVNRRLETLEASAQRTRDVVRVEGEFCHWRVLRSLS